MLVNSITLALGALVWVLRCYAGSCPAPRSWPGAWSTPTAAPALIEEARPRRGGRPSGRVDG